MVNVLRVVEGWCRQVPFPKNTSLMKGWQVFLHDVTGTANAKATMANFYSPPVATYSKQTKNRPTLILTTLFTIQIGSPVTDDTVDRCWYRWYHFQFNQQRKMIGIHVRMRTTNHLILCQPLGRQRTQQTKRCHCLFRIKDVIYDPLKIEPRTNRRPCKFPTCDTSNTNRSRVIGEWHNFVVIGRSELKGMCKFIWFITAQDLLQAWFIAQRLEVFMILRDAAST